MSNEIRMVKTTVQENHAVSVESRDYGKITNGRVTKLEHTVDGEKDTNGKIIKNREGILHDLNKIKKWSWFYSNWKIPVGFILLSSAIFIKESRDTIFGIFKFLK